jgi:hypothetical protein
LALIFAAQQILLHCGICDAADGNGLAVSWAFPP